MAIKGYESWVEGTPVIWGEDSGAGTYGTVTHTLDIDALAAGSGRQGDYADLGTIPPPYVAVQIIADVGSTAPTAGTTLDVFLGWSGSTSFFPGGLTGTAGAWPSDGNESEWANQVGSPAATLRATNDASVIQVGDIHIVRVKGRYVAPALVNNFGNSAALKNETTNSDNDTRVIMTPLYPTFVDAI